MTRKPTGAAFMLAQLGAHATRRFGERIAPLGITPPHAGILRIIASTPACSQQQLAARLGILPSRMVILIDELSDKGLVERRRSADDRRTYSLALTKRGTATISKLSRLVAEHEADLLTALDADERATLAKLCGKIVGQQRLDPYLHPGYRNR